MNTNKQGRLWLGGCLTVLLAACGQTAPPPAPAADQPGADPYAGGVSYPWTFDAPAGKVDVLTLTPDINSLTFEPLLAARNSWGPIELGRSNGEQGAGDGKTLTLGGKTYPRGFGVHAGSEMRFSLKGTPGAQCSRFTADIGIDDEVGSKGSVVFQVFLDGVKAYDSGTLTGSSATKKVDVDIKGKKELRLIVTDAGNGISYDHADWANPKIDCTPAVAAGPAGSLDNTFGLGGRASVGGVAATTEPDGSLLLADTVIQNFVLRRFSPNGDLIQTATDLGGDDVPAAVLRQSDGKIIVAGTSDGRFAAVRYLSNLDLDTTFGDGGILTTELAQGATAYAAALLPSGQLVIAGDIQQAGKAPYNIPSLDLTVARYSKNGKLDRNFGKSGVATLSFDVPGGDVSDDSARSIVVQPDGKLLVVGKSDPAGGALGRRGLILRLNTSGSLDTSFGSGGKVITNAYGIFNGAALEPDGSVVVVGYDGRYFGNGMVQRYSALGKLTGQATINFSDGGLGTENILGHVLVRGGKVMVGGANQINVFGTPVYAFARLNSDLSLDSGFGTGGKVFTTLPVIFAGTGTESLQGALLQQTDGKVMVISDQTERYWP